MKKLTLSFVLFSIVFLTNAQVVNLDVKVYLEGPYINTQMTPFLNVLGYLPLDQPYDIIPWNYSGNEEVTAIPNNSVVDWVLVDLLKPATDTDNQSFELIARKAGFILNDGTISDLDGTSNLTYTIGTVAELYVQINHRNHLPVVSAIPLTEIAGIYTYDFTSDASKAIGGIHAQKEVATGAWSMYSANGNASKQIDNKDKNEVWLSQAGDFGYLEGDYNMDSQVDEDDKIVKWSENVGHGTNIQVYPPYVFTCGDILIDDRDGSTYTTILIGEQCWMAENLKATTYQNGTPIPNVTDGNAWSNLTTGAYAWYENDISWKGVYGALYNWYAVDDANGLCPMGWSVPTNDEWTALTDYIGGTESPYGSELKSCRQVNTPLGGGCNTTEHPRWEEWSSNWGTNNYGFSGLPAGNRYFGTFNGIGFIGNWWSTTEYSSSHAWGRSLSFAYDFVIVSNYDKPNGFPVRCLRD